MSYAVDMLIAIICAMVAVLEIMQIKPTIRYVRAIGPDGEALPAGSVTDEDLTDPQRDLAVEVFATKSKACPMPEGEGWIRQEDTRPTVRSYVDAGFGIALALAAVSLVIGERLPTTPVAWLLFGAVVLEFVFDLPRFVRSLMMRQFSPLVFLPQILMALGLFAAYRLL